MKDCTTCPSFIPAASDATRVRFGRGTGTAMCGRFGHILSLPFMSEEQASNAALAFASKCDSHGLAAVEKPVSITPRVIKPNLPATTSVPDVLPSCSSCEHFVEAHVATEAFDIPLPICAAKGIAIFKGNREAKGCAVSKEAPYARPAHGLGHVPVSVSDLKDRDVIDELSGEFTVDVTTLLGSVAGSGGVEPTSYPTDKPVAAEDDAAGIRAWRRVEIGAGKCVYLPIFKTERFSEEHQALIPKTGGAGNPELFVDYSGILPRFAVVSFMLDVPFVMEGEPGVGKTEGARWLAWLMNLPFIRFQINRDTNPEDLVGKPHIESGTDYFEWGRLPIAWAMSCLLDIDEWNVGEEVLGQMFRSLFDDSKQLVLDANRGETVVRDPYNFPVLTQNPAHDIRNIGTNVQAAADVSRTMTHLIEMPPEALTLHIMKQRVSALDGEVIDDALLKRIYVIGQDIRQMAQDGTFPLSWGVREYIKVARLAVWFPLEECFKLAVLNACEAEVKDLILRSIRDREE